MNAYLTALTCLRCGGPLDHVNGAVQPTHAVAVARCHDPQCNREYALTVELACTSHRDSARGADFRRPARRMTR